MERATETDYGIIISQLGIDALEGSDQDLILSNNFPMLKIDKQFTTTVTLSSGTDATIATHDYGYPCFFWVYVVGAGFLLNDFITNFTVDNSTIKVNANLSGSYTFRVVTCRNPLNKAISTASFRTQSKEAALRNRDYGLLVAKEGKSIESQDYRDFTFHSDTRNLLIHKVDYREFGTGYPDGAGGTSTGYGMYTQNDLPYRPIFYAFVSLDNGVSYRLLFGGEQSAPGTRQVADGSIKTDGFDDGVNKQFGSIWMFKDPIEPSLTSSVVI